MPTGQYTRTEMHAGENHGMWKGDKAGYTAKHMWIQRQFGKADRCEECGLDKLPVGMKRYFDWVNLDGKYSRNRETWKKMCKKCHTKLEMHRISRGEKQGSSKLTEIQVIEIRNMKDKNPNIFNTRIAKMFNVNKSTINRILRRVTWAHI